MGLDRCLCVERCGAKLRHHRRLQYAATPTVWPIVLQSHLVWEQSV